jgi:hypothetical protein
MIYVWQTILLRLLRPGPGAPLPFDFLETGGAKLCTSSASSYQIGYRNGPGVMLFLGQYERRQDSIGMIRASRHQVWNGRKIHG